MVYYRKGLIADSWELGSGGWGLDMGLVLVAGSWGLGALAGVKGWRLGAGHWWLLDGGLWLGAGCRGLVVGAGGWGLGAVVVACEGVGEVDVVLATVKSWLRQRLEPSGSAPAWSIFNILLYWLWKSFVAICRENCWGLYGRVRGHSGTWDLEMLGMTIWRMMPVHLILISARHIELPHYITHQRSAGKVTFTLMECSHKPTYTVAGKVLEDSI